MEILLSDTEVRILGCLVEKERTTPDYYPLTLKALTGACNQKSNRDPVVFYEETTVVRGLDSLQKKGLTEKIYKADSRVPKYGHRFDEKFGLRRESTAVMCVLMLRGPQTLGELKARTERIHGFNDLPEVESVLKGLTEREEPLVIRLPRQAGRKERRYMHLLSGEPETAGPEAGLKDEAATCLVRSEDERMERLEKEVEALRRELDEFRKEFMDLKAQFE